jgi:hypothetical protein
MELSACQSWEREKSERTREREGRAREREGRAREREGRARERKERGRGEGGTNGIEILNKFI